jgi:hypothetical protein
MRRRPVALVLALFLLSVACGTKLVAAEQLTDTKTLVSDVIKELNAATSYHMVLSYQQGTQVDVSADLHFKLPDGDASGTVTENGNTVNVVESGGATYVQGKDFISEYGGSTNGTLFQDRWVRTTSDLLRTDVLDLTKLTALPAFFLDLNVNGKRVDHVAAATESTAELDSTWGKMYISELPPHRLVKIESTAGFVAAAGLSSVDFELLEYGDSVDVQVPTDFADPNNPDTLPPDYELAAKPSVPPCSYYSCAMSGKVVNKGGGYPPIGPSTFTFTVYDASPAQRPIDHCSGRIPTLKHGATANIACTIASQAWRNYTGSSFYWDVTIDNPNYDG